MSLRKIFLLAVLLKNYIIFLFINTFVLDKVVFTLFFEFKYCVKMFFVV